MENSQNKFKGLRLAYKKNEMMINIIVRFFVFLFVYISILKSDYTHSMFGFLSNTALVIIISVVCSILSVIAPSRIALFLLIICESVSVSSSFGLLLLTGSILFAVFVLFASINDNIAKVILFTICCFYLGVPYIAPIYIGVKHKSRNLFPVLLGVCTYYIVLASNNALVELLKIEELPTFLEQILFSSTYVLSFVLGGSTFTFMIISFIIVIIICEIIKLSGVNNNVEIGVVVAGVLFFVIAVVSSVFGGEINAFGMLPVLLISMLITYLLSIVDSIFDYKKAERVFFQDENNTYYVKIVPKIK